jgi:hypothetical protein
MNQRAQGLMADNDIVQRALQSADVKLTDNTPARGCMVSRTKWPGLTPVVEQAHELLMHGQRKPDGHFPFFPMNIAEKVLIDRAVGSTAVGSEFPPATRPFSRRA